MNTPTRIVIDGDHLRLEDVVAVARAWADPAAIRVELSADACARITRSRQAVEDFLRSGEIVYGVTTGFGHFKDRRIPPAQAARLQHNILVSHAVGVGEPVDQATTRAVMLIRANTLAKGYSGIRLETVQRLLDLINAGVHPCLPAQGSLGASGDLAPLAHMGLVVIGEGEAIYRGELLPAQEALRQAGFEPLSLGAKEGLALTNGTAFMAGIGCLVTARAELVAETADIAGALTCEALHGTARAFDERIHAVRPHPRQMPCAAYLPVCSRAANSYDPTTIPTFRMPTPCAVFLRCTEPCATPSPMLVGCWRSS